VAPQHRRCASTVYSAVVSSSDQSLCSACVLVAGRPSSFVCFLLSSLVVLGFVCHIFYCFKSLQNRWCLYYGVFASCSVWSVVCCCCYYVGSSDCVGNISKGVSFFFNGEGDGLEKEQREYDENALGTEWTLCGVHLYERLVWA